VIGGASADGVKGSNVGKVGELAFRILQGILRDVAIDIESRYEILLEHFAAIRTDTLCEKANVLLSGVRRADETLMAKSAFGDIGYLTYADWNGITVGREAVRSRLPAGGEEVLCQLIPIVVAIPHDQEMTSVDHTLECKYPTADSTPNPVTLAEDSRHQRHSAAVARFLASIPVT